MIIGKQFTFNAAHFLPNYKGKCNQLHGHTYTLEVAVEGDVQENGMVMDYKDLSNIVKENAINKLDHSKLNNIIENPTAELIAKYIWNILEHKLNLKDELKLKYIKVKETPTSFAIYDGK